MCALAAEASARPPATMLVGSTGVIGRPLPIDKIRDGIARIDLTPAGGPRVRARDHDDGHAPEDDGRALHAPAAASTASAPSPRAPA